MKKKITDTILKRLHLVREDVARTWADMSSKDSKLAADLVLECQRMSEENDALVKEKESLVDILREINRMIDDALDLLR